MFNLLLSQVVVLVGLATLVWIVSVRRRDASIVDPCWGLGFVVVAWFTFSQLESIGDRARAVLVLTTLWGLRLCIYLAWRNRREGEDRRYAAMRAWHGPAFWWRSWFTVFLSQALILWWISFPLTAAMLSPQQSLRASDALSLSLWLIGITCETLGDWQLAAFRANPLNHGRVLDRGLWRYTRHPNYFGDFCVWWAFYGLAANAGGAWVIGSPLSMSILLMYVSGVRLTERQMAHRRPEYRRYQQQTSSFFPWFPRATKEDAHV